MKKIIQSLLGIAIALPGISQERAASGSDWMSRDIFKTNVFIQNNGQLLDDASGSGEKIKFNTTHAGTELYWTAKGLTYRATDKYYMTDEEIKEKLEEKARELAAGIVESEPRVRKKMHYYLNMEFIGSDLSTEIVPEEKVAHYFTYGDPTDASGSRGIKTSGYNKIRYKNVYPGIDVEFILPKKGGIKYSFVVHPGADVSLINIRYSGANHVVQNSKGEIEIYSKKCGNYREHLPESFYADGTPVSSGFKLNNGIISFDVPSYDKTKTLIIDPWVSNFTAPTFTNPTSGGTFAAYKNIGYDVAYDVHNNVWAYGGGDPFFLAKYDPSGNLLWVFSVPLVGEIVGDFDLNKQSGTAYVSEGWADLGARVVKVNSAGMLQKTSPKNTHNEEIGRIRLDCNGKLYTTGGGAPVTYSPVQWQACSMDTDLTALTGMHITSSLNVDHDVSLMCIDPATNAMYMNFNRPCPGSPDFLNDNEMHKLPLPGFAPSTWMNPGPVHNFQELVSVRYAGPCLTCFGNVPARLNVFNGMVAGNGFLYTYDGRTLKKFDKASGTQLASVLTGGKRYWSGGIDLDKCENVYVSVSNAVNMYDASLTLIKSFPLTDTSCYDIRIDKENSKLYATGNNYVRGIDIDPTPVMQLTVTATPPTCACSGTATAQLITPPNSIPCSNTSYTYQWMPGGQTTTSVSNLCAGTYTVIAFSQVACAPAAGDTAIIIVPPGGGTLNAGFTVSPACGNVTFADTSNLASATYTWSFPGGVPASANTAAPPNVLYPTGTYTASLIVSAGGGCVDTVYQIFTIGGSPVAAINPSSPCIGGSTNLQDGSVPAAGDPIVSWSWLMNGGAPASATSQNTSTIYGTAGTHTVQLVVTSQQGCKDTITQQVLVYNPPVANFSGPMKGCAPVCNTYVDSSTSTDGSITSWTWSFPGGSPAASNVQNPPNICYNTPGTYGATLIITSSYGCSDTLTLPAVEVYPWPQAEFCVAPLIAPATDPVFSFCDMWSSDVVKWTWNFGDNDTDFINTDPVHSYSATAHANDFYTYNICIKVQNQYGCWDTICHPVELIPEFTFYIPNTFTPNGDWMNEFFYGKSRGVKEYNIWLFDRWGNQIWDCHHEGKNTDWDDDNTAPRQEGLSSFCQWDGVVQQGGMDMGGDSKQLAQEDVYVWKVKLTDIFDKQHSYLGHVNIVR